jgi:hypothetical protein
MYLPVINDKWHTVCHSPAIIDCVLCTIPSPIKVLVDFYHMLTKNHTVAVCTDHDQPPDQSALGDVDPHCCIILYILYHVIPGGCVGNLMRRCPQ